MTAHPLEHKIVRKKIENGILVASVDRLEVILDGSLIFLNAYSSYRSQPEPEASQYETVSAQPSSSLARLEVYDLR